MIINGERSLAYIAKITDIQPIPNYDRVELATINDGWRVIISKADHFIIGDWCIYFEIDSKVPEDDERFAFLAKRNFRVKTLKMCGTVSQGLVCPIVNFPEIADKTLGEDVGKILNVTYYEAEDNQRKDYSTRSDFQNSLKARHPKLYRTWVVKWLLKREWGRNLLNKLFRNKRKEKRGFPTFVSKTDEERVENCAWVLGDGNDYVLTEKLDGTSSTYALERKGKRKFEFYVCSRNVRQENENQACYHEYNIYWAMAKKYNIEENLKKYLNANPDIKWVCIQGESVGKVQGNPLKLDEDDLYVFNFITSKDGRWDSRAGKQLVEEWGMKWVPILGVGKTQDNMPDMKKFSHGNSVVNPNVLREGIVYRSLDGQRSFKNVDPEYLLKHNQ